MLLLSIRFNRDMLVEDIRSSIQYILGVTGRPHLTYVGHSQGTNICFALLTSYPEMKRKINLFMGNLATKFESRDTLEHVSLPSALTLLFLALAPAVYVKHQRSKMMTYLANMQTDKIFQMLGIRAFLATGLGFVNSLAPGACLFLSFPYYAPLIHVCNVYMCRPNIE